MLRALPRFDYRVRWAGASDKGRVRPNNEDVWKVDSDFGLFVIADGMGGHNAGEIAAALCVETVIHELKQKHVRRDLERYVATPTLSARRDVFGWLRRAAETANQAVRQAGETTPEHRGMGCTLDVVLLLRDRGFVAHAGDSRVYLARSVTTIQLTHDHGLNESLAAQGKAKLSDTLRRRNALVNAVGRGPTLQVDTIFVDINRGDRFVLCTDGIHGALADEAVVGSLSRNGAPDDAVASLIHTALERGSRDNVTALVIEIGDRFITRTESDGGIAAKDLDTVKNCPLFTDLGTAHILAALTAAVEVEVAPGEMLPRTVANDHVAYIVIDGEAQSPDSRTFGAPALVYPESLVDVDRESFWQAKTQLRALRLRADDLREVCGDARLGAALFERLARHIARSR
ncbi:MAG: protein phosphatase 2C domain-containing protein [Polyangiaceae bacterium]